MTASTLRTATAILAACLACGCSASNPHDHIMKPDAMVQAPVPPPKVTDTPQATPLSTVAVQGTTQGVSVVIEGGGATRLISDALPGGGFCQDVPLQANQDNNISLYALGGDGRISQPTKITVTQSSSAPMPSVPYCSGVVGGQCGKTEICGNGKDDDCNGETDQCDPACNKCVDDDYEPNDQPVLVPMLDPGSYSLRICPCHDDWFSFRAQMGGVIHVLAEFQNSQMDLDLELYRAGPSGDGVGDKVASSMTKTNMEEINWTADMAGTYYLHAFVFGDMYGSGSYTLTVY